MDRSPSRASEAPEASRTRNVNSAFNLARSRAAEHDPPAAGPIVADLRDQLEPPREGGYRAVDRGLVVRDQLKLPAHREVLEGLRRPQERVGAHEPRRVEHDPRLRPGNGHRTLRSDERDDAAVFRGGERDAEEYDHVLHPDAVLDGLLRDPEGPEDLDRRRARADVDALRDRVPQELAQGREPGEPDVVRGALPHEVEPGRRAVDPRLRAHRGGPEGQG